MTDYNPDGHLPPRFPETLVVNGRNLHAADIRSYALELSEPGGHAWKKALGEFLLQWISDKPWIDVRTSGSTGRPVWMQHTREAMRSSAMATGTFFGFRPGMTVLLCLSAEHIAGMMMVVRALVYGMNLLTLPPVSSPLEYLPENTPVDFAAMVPAQVHASLMDSGTRDKLLAIKTLLLGGAPLSPVLETSVAESHPNAWCGFGMTETITHVALRKIQRGADPGVYSPLPGVGVSLNGLGCLILDVPFSDSTVETRDAGELLPDGRFRWLGREDFVINSGGIKIYPEQLEREIGAFFPHPFLITSIPNEAKGEAVVMVVVHQPVLPAGRIEEWKALLSHKLPKKHLPADIRVVDAFTYTSPGKVDRAATLAGSRPAIS